MEEYMLPCMFKSAFGFDCIGCGIQRAIVLVFKGNFTEAFHMFPAVFTTLLFFMSLALHLFDKKHTYHKIVILLAITNALIMIISYVYKMRFLYN